MKITRENMTDRVYTERVRDKMGREHNTQSGYEKSEDKMMREQRKYSVMQGKKQRPKDKILR